MSIIKDEEYYKHYSMFENKEAAIDVMASLLHLSEELAKRHNVPLIVAYQPNDDYISTYHHLPENTGSELKAAWHEIDQTEESRP